MLDPKTLAKLYEIDFQDLLTKQWAEWRARYLDSVRRAQSAERAEWMTPEFQRFLWEDDGVSGIGQGKSVTVEGAYTDVELVERLWALRHLELAADPNVCAKQLSDSFTEILEGVSPRYNERRPSARLLRLFCLLFPEDVLVLLDGHKTNVVRRGLGMKKAGLSTIAQHVLVRRKLVEALGERTGLEAQIDLSMFTWLLFTQLEEAEAQEEGHPSEAPESKDVLPDVEPGGVPKLRLLPWAEQRKGIFAIASPMSTVKRLLRFVENGATRDELVDEILEIFPNLKRSSAGMRVSLLRAPLGLIELRDQALRPTARGIQILEGEDAGEILGPVLIARVFGFAQLLAALRDHDTLSKPKLYEALQEIYPRWTTSFAPSSLLSWATALGLVESVSMNGEEVERLTESGNYWASGLPEDLSAWRPPPDEAEQTIPDEDDEEAVEVAAPAGKLRHPAFEALAARFETAPELQGLIFPKAFVAKVDAALRALPSKRFVLLAGLSGTGKTSLARAYAQACCAELGLPLARHFLLVPVRPDWTDPSGLLGYLNPLADPPRYHETAALQLVLAAAAQPTEPFFLCLDEMNLARVEHYFAPFLAAMEGRGYLQIQHEREKIDGVPPRVPWPANLFIIGTVNMDETTHPFSDKVLDRAFSFELWDVDIRAWRNRVEGEGGPAELVATVGDTLQHLYDALYPARRHFGYRTCDEVLAFCRTAKLPVEEALDAAVLAKVLPKLRGDDTGELPAALDAVRVVCQERGLVECKSRVEQMSKSMAERGMAKFWA